jgi:hypothetical protein
MNGCIINQYSALVKAKNNLLNRMNSAPTKVNGTT